MDDFEVYEVVANLELQVDKLEQTVDNFIKGFDGKLQNQIAGLVERLLEEKDKPNPEKISTYDDYIVKLLCSLGYGQYCIIQNQKEIIKLLGGKNVGLSNMSLDAKRNAVEKILNEIEDPYQKVHTSNKK